jgi:dTDP-4-dehydrorhamnose reductase
MKFSKQTKIYITGCGGMLGHSVYELFSAVGIVQATDIDINEPWLEYADVRDYRCMENSIKSFVPDLIINLAAKTDMEECEREPENAWMTNALGAENIALLAEEMGVPYIYISTAGIFDGEKEYYNDYDEPNPLSVYAKSKYAGEMFIKQYVSKHYVVRAGWMMGGGPRKDKKFINKIYKQIIDGATELNVVDDKLGTPTYTRDFAFGLLKLAESGQYGVYNQVCEGSCSRFDVAEEFVRLLGLSGKIGINKVSSDFFRHEYFAPRPRSEKLINMKLKARGLDLMRDWKICLQEYSKEFIDDQNRIIPIPFSG